MPCGLCGGAGHNRRTCGLGDTGSSNVKKISTQTGVAEVSTKKTIANSRTSEDVADKDKTTSPVSKTQLGAKKDAKKTTTPGYIALCDKCGTSSHSKSSCSVSKKDTLGAEIKSKNKAEPIINKVKSTSTILVEENEYKEGIIFLKPSASKDKSQAKASENNKETKNSKGTDNTTNVVDARKLCSVCRKGGHNQRSCPDRKPENWFTQAALERLNRGLTEKDEAGFIYMYKKSKPESVVDENWFKIGQSKILPERRVRHLASKNKEEYTLLWSKETPCRFLTEKVIHKQLEAFHAPKEEGEGKTEWYLGNRQLLTESAQKVIKEIDILFLDDRIKHLSPSPIKNTRTT